MCVFCGVEKFLLASFVSYNERDNCEQSQKLIGAGVVEGLSMVTGAGCCVHFCATEVCGHEHFLLVFSHSVPRLLNNRWCEGFSAIMFSFFSVYFTLSTEHGVSLLLDHVL